MIPWYRFFVGIDSYRAIPESIVGAQLYLVSTEFLWVEKNIFKKNGGKGPTCAHRSTMETQGRTVSTHTTAPPSPFIFIILCVCVCGRFIEPDQNGSPLHGGRYSGESIGSAINLIRFGLHAARTQSTCNLRHLKSFCRGLVLE